MEVPWATVPSASGFAFETCPKNQAVEAATVVLLSVAGVGTVTVPVRVGDAVGARDVSVGWTWSMGVHLPLVPAAAVPSMAGEAVPFCPITKAVVAICVVLVSAAAVGAAGVPVNVGESRGAVPEMSVAERVVHAGAALTEPVPVWERNCFAEVVLPASRDAVFAALP